MSSHSQEDQESQDHLFRLTPRDEKLDRLIRIEARLLAIDAAQNECIKALSSIAAGLTTVLDHVTKSVTVTNGVTKPEQRHGKDLK